MSRKISLRIKRGRSGKESVGYPEYPSLYISDIKLPLDKKQVGKVLSAIVTLKFTGYREDNSTKKNHISHDFAIMDIEFLNSVVDKTKYRLNDTFKK